MIGDLSYLESIDLNSFTTIIEKSDYINTLALCQVSKIIKQRCNNEIIKKLILNKRDYIEMIEPKVYLIDMDKFWNSKEWKHMFPKIIRNITSNLFIKINEQYINLINFYSKFPELYFSDIKYVILLKKHIEPAKIKKLSKKYNTTFIVYDIVNFIITHPKVDINDFLKRKILFGYDKKTFKKKWIELGPKVQKIFIDNFKPLFKTEEDKI